MARRKLGVALVGLGEYAETSIAPEIVAACEHVRLAGVVTSDPRGKGSRWAAKYGFQESAVYSYETMDRMADNPDIDFVHVATPTGKHCEHTIAAARAGKHVMVEKPMAISVSECQRMMDACDKAGVKLGVNYRLLWEPHHRTMIELARSGEHGKIKCITAEFSWKRGDIKPWLIDPTLAGRGAFWDTGVYLIQAGCYLTGENPSRITAVPTTTRDVYPSTIEETMSVVLQYPSGAVLLGRSSYAAYLQTLICACENGTFRCDGAPLGGTTFGQTIAALPNPKAVESSSGQTIKHKDTMQVAVLLDAFAQSIMSSSPFPADGHMGLRDVTILEAAYRSIASATSIDMSWPGG